MRRRAASNNPKRLPKSLQANSGQTNSNGKKRKKSKSRNVKTRNKDPRRTPLHLWFAKRFKFITKWNILIPYKNNCKNQRLLYRCGKNGYNVFYMPFIKHLFLDYNSSKDALFVLLSHFMSDHDLKSLINLSDTQHCTIFLHKYDQYPLQLIGPLQCTLFARQNSLMVSSHVSTVQSLVDSLAPHFGESFGIRKNVPLSHIRLYGAKASQHLNRLFYPTKKFLGDKLPLNQLSFFQVQRKVKTPDSECTAEPEQFIEQVNAPSDTTKQQMPPTIIAFQRHFIGKLESIDLLVANSHLKAIWNRLTENMSHLVGGFRDLEVLALETRSTFFPSIGYFDADVNCENSLPLFDAQAQFVVRNRSITESLSVSSLNWLTNIEQKDSATVYVTIEYVRGKPTQNDLLYLPNTEVLQSYLSGSRNVQDMQTAIAAGDGKAREPIGFVEFGSFSLEAARCRAIAVVALSSLQEMMTTQRNQLYAVVKTKFNILYLVTVSLMNPFNLT